MKTRVVSSIIAVIVLIAFSYWFGSKGMLAITFFVTAVCAFEYWRLMSRKLNTPFSMNYNFYVWVTGVFFATAFFLNYAALVLAVGSIFFLIVALMQIESNDDLAKTLQIQSAGSLGLIYCGLFPGFASKLLLQPRGLTLLVGLLAIVFAGDTLAYLTGRAFGKTKLLEPVSPKKTIEGAIGGLCGSALAGAVYSYFFFDGVPTWAFVGTAIITGMFAQLGDLFESILKRVAEVKDSGSIMPGHGGLLDRVDGIYFGAPIYFVMLNFWTPLVF